MRIEKVKRIGIGFLSMVLLSCMAWAAENTQNVGNLAMPLTQQGGTARGMAMGSAVVGVPQGSASLFWNPAGLGRLDSCGEIGLHNNVGLAGSNQDTVVFATPVGSIGGVAASLNYVDNGTFQGRDSVGNLTNSYSAGDIGASIGWGKELLPGFSAGAALKYNQQNLASTYYSAYAADIGILWNPLSAWNFGATYSNLGTKVGGSLLDSGFRVGASYNVTKDLLLALSSELKPAGFDQMQVGGEYGIGSILTLRAGYVYNFTDSQLTGLTGLTAGLGIKVIDNLMLDYAYLPYGELGAEQLMSVTWKFTCSTKEVAKTEPAPVAEVQPAPVAEAPNVVVPEKLIVLDDSHFEFNSSTLTPAGAKIVAQNAQVLRDNPETKILIAGYASCSGTMDYNQKLSERRANAVREILIKEGNIAPERLTTIGYGETRPAEHEAECKVIDSKEAKANMRVLFEIIVK